VQQVTDLIGNTLVTLATIAGTGVQIASAANVTWALRRLKDVLVLAIPPNHRLRGRPAKHWVNIDGGTPLDRRATVAPNMATSPIINVQLLLLRCTPAMSVLYKVEQVTGAACDC
jgi:hypothetical protein